MASISASGAPDYSNFTDSIELPFTNFAKNQITPAIDILVNDVRVETVALDSGSTIFAISPELVEGFPEDTSDLTPGVVEYTSDRVWSGFWYGIKVTFDDKKGKTATAQVQALVVTKQMIGEVEEYDTIHYMGIAFGLLNSAKGFIPEKNALLAITKFGNQVVDSSTFRHGYIMRKKSIIIGLTEQNTNSFKCTKLSAGDNWQRKWYWDDVGCAIKLDKGAWMHGSALIDSGVTKMTLWSTQYSGEPTVLPAGTDVTMSFPNENSDLPKFTFHWPEKDGRTEPWLPLDINVRQSARVTSYVNTGQNFLSKFDTLYDADEGYWGLREATE